MESTPLVSQCGNCGNVQLNSHKCRMQFYPDGQRRLAFQCPHCFLVNIVPMGERFYNQLFMRVPRIDVNYPAEVKDPKRERTDLLTEVEINAAIEDFRIYSDENIIKEAMSYDSGA